MAPIDIHWCSLNVSRDQTVEVSPVRWWVVHFRSGNNNMKDKLHTGWPCTFLGARHVGFCSVLVKMYSWWWWLCWKVVFCSWEFALSSRVTELFVSVVLSMEINRRHYSWSNLRIWGLGSLQIHMPKEDAIWSLNLVKQHICKLTKQWICFFLYSQLCCNCFLQGNVLLHHVWHTLRDAQEAFSFFVQFLLLCPCPFIFHIYL